MARLFGVMDDQVELQLPGPGRWGRRLAVLGVTLWLVVGMGV